MNERVNATKRHLIRTSATLLVIVSLAGCMTSEPSTPSVGAITPEPAVTAPDAVVPQPSPTGNIQEEVPAPDAVPTSNDTATEDDPSREVNQDVEWVQETFGTAWNIGYPVGWTVNTAGAHEGALQLEGEYAGHQYAMTFSYPIGILVSSLEEWLEEALAPLTPEQRQNLVIQDVTVANTPAKKVLNHPVAGSESAAHHVYIWRSEEKNPRLITITQIDEQPLDTTAMEQLLDQFLAAIQE